MALDIVEDREGDVVVLLPVGRLDTSTSRDFERHALKKLGEGDVHYVVDFEQVEYVSSAGLRVLLMLAKRLPGMRGTLVLCGLSPQVLEVFEIAGFSKIFTIVPNRPHALSQTEKLRTGGKAPKGRSAAPAAKPARPAAARPAASGEPAAEKPVDRPAPAKAAAEQKAAAPPAARAPAAPVAPPAATEARKPEPSKPEPSKPEKPPADKPKDDQEAVEDLAVELLRETEAPPFLEE